MGRDDGRQAGEYSPVFYDKTVFRDVGWRTVWLSSTPGRPSKGWDANLPRIATFLTLESRESSESEDDSVPPRGRVHVCNTHWDDSGVVARAQSAYVIRHHFRLWVEAHASATTSTGHGDKFRTRDLIVLMGDFNSPPTDTGYRRITDPGDLPDGSESLHFSDSFYTLETRPNRHEAGGPQTGPSGPVGTYTSFDPPSPTKRDADPRIDFIMVATESMGWGVKRYACVDNWVDGDAAGWKGRFSDHRIVRVVVEHE